MEIFIITDMNTGYRFDTSLNLRQTLNLGPLGDFTTVSCHGFHSNLLAYATNNGSLTMINTRKSTLVKRIHVAPDFFTEISMTRKFIMAGTAGGIVHLWDRTGTLRLEFKAGDYVHSVSIRDSMIMAATNKRVYIWDLDRHGEPRGPDLYGLNIQDDVLWACFSPFQRQPGNVPFLIGKPGYKPQWERDFRPMILRAYSAEERQFALSTTGRKRKRLKVRDLESRHVIRNIRLKGEPHMLWTNCELLFVVYNNSKRVEMTSLNGDGRSITNRSAYLESVSLHLLDGP